MPRNARIDIPGLLQHVIVRGVARNDIFLDDQDREEFVRRLSALLADTSTRCFAWTLLNNHFHLLLMPTEQPLARLMRRLLTGYAVVFNLRYKRSGNLFQKRYKSIVFDADNYLLELVRYIHLNPIRAGMVASLEALSSFRWSGHRQLLGTGADQLVCADHVLSLFARREKEAVARYLDFLADGLRGDAGGQLSGGGRRVSRLLNSTLADEDRYDDRILGGGEFVDRVLEAFGREKEKTLPLEEVVNRIAGYCDVRPEDLRRPCRQAEVFGAKALICYWATRRCRIPGIEVVNYLGYSRSAASLAAKRGQQLMEQHGKLEKFLQ